MHCHKCGAQNDDQAAFCDKCGAALQKPRPETSVAPPPYIAAVQYAGFWRRFAAAFIDGLIVGAVQIVLFVVLLAAGAISMSNLQPDASAEEYSHAMLVVYIVSAALLPVEILFFSIMESSSRQATPGKMVLGIRVTDIDEKRVSLGRAIGRNLIKLAPGIVVIALAIVIFAVASDPMAMSPLISLVSILLLVPYVAIAFTAKRQGLHDIIANCLVVMKR